VPKSPGGKRSVDACGKRTFGNQRLPVLQSLIPPAFCAAALGFGTALQGAKFMDSATIAARRSTPKSLQVAAAVIGNALEWYDFYAFGFLTVVISRLFFPAESQYASLLLTTAIFGVGFLMRPVGGVVLGIYTDRRGRKAGLQLILALMTAAIAMMAFAPTYAAIGIAAPLIIVFARLLQGFATGGEYGSAVAFLIESAPADRRGFYGSGLMVGAGMAVLMGALISSLVTRSLAPDALDSWGWRIPYLFGLIIGPVGLYIRRHVEEPEAFLEARAALKEKAGFGRMIATHSKQVVVCLGVFSHGATALYVILLYMPTFASTQLHLPLGEAFVAQAVGLACFVSLIPLFGALSDRIGRKPVLVASLVLFLGVAYPLFSWVHANPSFRNLLSMQIVLCAVLGAFYGPWATALAEQFPTHIRASGLGIVANLGATTLGGFAPFFVTWLIEATGSPIAPVFYVMFGAAISLVAAFFLVDRAQEVRLPVLEAIPFLR
jgi:MHS family proline/betaine transporter-like MFS transporter